MGHCTGRPTSDPSTAWVQSAGTGGTGRCVSPGQSERVEPQRGGDDHRRAIDINIALFDVVVVFYFTTTFARRSGKISVANAHRPLPSTARSIC